MNIEKINQINYEQNTSGQQVKNSSNSDFSNELKELKEIKKTKEDQELKDTKDGNEIQDTQENKNIQNVPIDQEVKNSQENQKKQKNKDSAHLDDVQNAKKISNIKKQNDIKDSLIQKGGQSEKEFLNVEKHNDIKDSLIQKDVQREGNVVYKMHVAKENQQTENIVKIQKKENIFDTKTKSRKVENAIKDLNKVVEELNQSDEKKESRIKKKESLTDINDMINKDFNIKENDKLPQMQASMNFNSNGQPFSSFMDNSKNSNNPTLGAKAQDLAEEAEILSTMAENIAIANKNTMLKSEEVEIIDETGIKKVDSKTRVVIDTIVKYDTIIMNQADVEVFTELVQKGELSLNEISSENIEKSMQISKTLADMLAKAKENNQPLRIDFDNNISVIIRINREGKIRADFLPSSQVAEAYLKENLPLLRQKFDESNIDYESLNQKERKENSKENNRKKGQKNE